LQAWLVTQLFKYSCLSIVFLRQLFYCRSGWLRGGGGIHLVCHPIIHRLSTAAVVLQAWSDIFRVQHVLFRKL
jgi:hypothetical protein